MERAIRRILPYVIGAVTGQILVGLIAGLLKWPSAAPTIDPFSFGDWQWWVIVAVVGLVADELMSRRM